MVALPIKSVRPKRAARGGPDLVVRFTAKQATLLWVLLDATLRAQDELREAAKWKRLRDKFRLPTTNTRL